MRTIATWVTALLVVIGLGVAIEAGVGSTPLGTVAGQVIQVGGLATRSDPNPHQVVGGVVTLTSRSSGAEYQVSSGRSRGYSIEVPPGTYTVDGISLDDYSDGNPMHAYGHSPVVVTAGQTVHVDLYVQIR